MTVYYRITGYGKRGIALAQVIAHLPAEQLQTPCSIGSYETCTLEFLVSDYIDHLNRHLQKIRERVSAPRR